MLTSRQQQVGFPVLISESKLSDAFQDVGGTFELLFIRVVTTSEEAED